MVPFTTTPSLPTLLKIGSPLLSTTDRALPPPPPQRKGWEGGRKRYLEWSYQNQQTLIITTWVLLQSSTCYYSSLTNANHVKTILHRLCVLIISKECKMLSLHLQQGAAIDNYMIYERAELFYKDKLIKHTIYIFEPFSAFLVSQFERCANVTLENFRKIRYELKRCII